MTRNSSFTKSLIMWYRKNARDLPWRRTNDPYKIWISEIMLQQTTVNAVLPYYERWIKSFPTMKSVARAPMQKILNEWQGLGYYQRAKNIQKSAKIICDVHRCRIPQDPDVLKKLPGFGPYTVGAVLSIAFDKRLPIIDANIRRVIMRQLAIQEAAGSSREEKILKYLDSVMPHKGNNIFNQALMELGALICRNRQPLCLKCPVRNSCQAYETGMQEIIPPVKKTTVYDLNAVVAVIERKGNFLIQKRSSKGLLADLWEFPGGKIEKKESAKQALTREIQEEVGVTLAGSQYMMNLQHFYTQFRVKLQVFTCELKDSPKVDKNRKWVSLRSLTKYPMPSGSARIVERLLERKRTKLPV